ncbi:MAG: hypothetical protein ACREHG_10780, partial [Candidatus Saccharimonadales bacterium]
MKNMKIVKLGLLVVSAAGLLVGAIVLMSLPVAKTAAADSCSGSVPVYRVWQFQYPYFTNDNFYTTNP